jgi:hypothetical protein
MKKLGLKIAVFGIIISYAFTVSFSMLREVEPAEQKDGVVIKTIYIDPENNGGAASGLEYFAEALNKIYDTIAGVSRIVKG